MNGTAAGPLTFPTNPGIDLVPNRVHGIASRLPVEFGGNRKREALMRLV
jgi:hypothetical protein